MAAGSSRRSAEEETLPKLSTRIGDDKIPFRLRLSALGWNFPYVVSTIRGRKDIRNRPKSKVLEKRERFYGCSDMRTLSASRWLFVCSFFVWLKVALTPPTRRRRQTPHGFHLLSGSMIPTPIGWRALREFSPSTTRRSKSSPHPVASKA